MKNKIINLRTHDQMNYMVFKNLTDWDVFIFRTKSEHLIHEIKTYEKIANILPV